MSAALWLQYSMFVSWDVVVSSNTDMCCQAIKAGCIKVGSSNAVRRLIIAISFRCAAMAPRKRPAATRKNSGSNMTKKDLQKACRTMLPKARTSYALFLQETYPTERERLLAEGLSGRDLQRRAIACVANLWRELSDEEKAEWQARASHEVAARQASKARILNTSEVPDDDGLVVQGDDVNIGDFVLEDTVLWQGACSWSQKAHHKDLLMSAQAIHFNRHDPQAYIQELKVLAELNKQTGSFVEDLYLRQFFSSSVDSPNLIAIYECLPRMDYYIEKEGPLSGFTFMAMIKQLAKAVAQLHDLQICHGDIKVASLFFSVESNTLKLGRFQLAISVPHAPGVLETPRYTGSCRAPELWGPLTSLAINFEAEAWAFAMTVAEMRLGKTLLDEQKKIVQCDLSCLSKVPEGTRNLVMPFLVKNPRRRMLVKDLLKPDVVWDYANL